MIQELELVEDEINELNNEQQAIELIPNITTTTPIASTSTTTTTTTAAVQQRKQVSPKKIKKLFRLKRIKSVKDLLQHIRRNQDEIDYGTILYVGK